jgi:hypothetical protein
MCVAVDYVGALFTSRAPTGDASAWTAVHPSRGEGGGTHPPNISCGSPSLCVETVGGAGIVSTSPLAGAAKWMVQQIDPISYDLSAISCAAASLCTAVSGDGYATVGIPKLTLERPLTRHLVPRGGAGRTAAVLEHGGYKFVFRAPIAGHLVISWYLGVGGAHGKRAIGTATKGFSRGRVKIVVRLTGYGRKVLRGASRLSTTVKAAYTARGFTKVEVAMAFILR